MYEELKQTIISLLVELAKSEVDLSKAVPHASFSGRGKALSKLSSEELNRELNGYMDKFEKEVPKEQQESILTKFVEQLKEASKLIAVTKDRIDSRVQPQGKERITKPFQSFCKRKKEW